MKTWGFAVVCLMIGCGGRLERNEEGVADVEGVDVSAPSSPSEDAGWDVIHLEPPPPWDGGARDASADAVDECHCVWVGCSAPPGCR